MKPGLFVYECARIMVLAAFAAMQPFLSDAMLTTDLAVFPILVFAAPSALLPLMAMFLWLDASRYRAYLPLFLAGKCLNIVSLLGWSIIVRHLTILRRFSGLALAEWLLLGGDLLALAAAILILRKTEARASEVK